MKRAFHNFKPIALMIAIGVGMVMQSYAPDQHVMAETPALLTDLG